MNTRINKIRNFLAELLTVKNTEEDERVTDSPANTYLVRLGSRDNKMVFGCIVNADDLDEVDDVIAKEFPDDGDYGEMLHYNTTKIDRSLRGLNCYVSASGKDGDYCVQGGIIINYSAKRRSKY